ncbi:DUF6680 family protein [Anthocerotibacter panamensis]|uniref:DUF6680 family protein n=1 Tax=Anthocerotibacter panamensis TaxID=2857077 RepID=UPI001C4043D8|nr:DUF6680 family protein [Anthocerotibacter panamensis]
MSFTFDWSVRVTDIIMVVAVLVGPIIAVAITLWTQDRQEKSKAKRDLFLLLMGERQHLVISYQVARALNTIDVVFSGCAPVLQAWHKYYELLSQPPSQLRVHTWLELLTAMASELGYSIRQTDLDKFYLPQGHADDLDFQREVGREWLRVLKATHSLSIERRE